MREHYVMALDQGTTSSRAAVFDRHGRLRAMAAHEFKQRYPRAGWVEHDPEEIWQAQSRVTIEALSKAAVDPSQIEAVGITNQRETTVIWERDTGRPIHPAIVWQDRRTASTCDRLKASATNVDRVRDRTGLIIDSYFSATKIAWLLDHVDGARKRAEAGELAFGTMDTWLVWKLTAGAAHVTDVTNASRTMLFNIHALQWDRELLSLFDIPEALLPAVASSSEVYGHTREPFIPAGVPIAGIAGDQQAALFGQRCNRPGMVKNTYGTGCFMIMNTGDRPVRSNNGLLTTVACRIGSDVVYALEGSIFVAGAVVQWLRDKLGMIESADRIEALAGSVDDNDGVYLVPAFTGLGAPHWNHSARAVLSGLTLGTTAAHVARAALEGVAYQVRDVLTAMEADAGISIPELRVDGGMTVNDLLMQFQADILQAPVIRPREHETTALGAAYLAGLATGFWNGVDEIDAQWQPEHQFDPAMAATQADALIAGWQRALRAVQAGSGG